jgi:hypothetical protein
LGENQTPAKLWSTAKTFRNVGSAYKKRGSANMRNRLLALMVAFVVVGCAGPRPILYPNPHLKDVGQPIADRDIAECRALAEKAGAKPGNNKAAETAKSTVVGGGIGAATGAVGGAVAGAVGQGSMIGAAVGATAGLLRGLLSSPRPSPAYIGYVNRCLNERGYDVVGWEK